MKKLITLIFITLLLPLTACAKQFEEGTHYTTFEGMESSKPEVKEYFSFYCPHCFNFEPLVKSIKGNLPEGVKFEKSHVDFLRAASPEIQHALTRAMVVAKHLKMEDKLNKAIFEYIHKQRAPFTSEKDIRNLFVLQGVDGEKFDKLMKSFPVKGKANAMKKSQDELTRRGVLTSVPTFIVNGKYKIIFDDLDRNNFEAELKALIAHLSAKK
ncbi:thiol:disulfide interchange protein DsbA/DsbL [Flocculibacter collagenilyticus]|uniref:thiol:disulfide interchange protein DsbA/DsbL n=1 Tax=Flocculibacter collagenilyticus TaxID=2744479 RepID=UPI0018F760D3|nr:thiol:disulfide interchange protein DsbA/DsbL [Flocculibacter collagenilyticus]